MMQIYIRICSFLDISLSELRNFGKIITGGVILAEIMRPAKKQIFASTEDSKLVRTSEKTKISNRFPRGKNKECYCGAADQTVPEEDILTQEAIKAAKRSLNTRAVSMTTLLYTEKGMEEAVRIWRAFGKVRQEYERGQGRKGEGKKLKERAVTDYEAREEKLRRTLRLVQEDMILYYIYGKQKKQKNATRTNVTSRPLLRKTSRKNQKSNRKENQRNLSTT